MKRGKINNSRKEAGFIKNMSLGKQERYIKQFIAACEAKELEPFIKITSFDRGLREVNYVINVDDLEEYNEALQESSILNGNEVVRLKELNSRYKQAIQGAKEVAENAEESDEMTIVWDITNETLEEHP